MHSMHVCAQASCLHHLSRSFAMSSRAFKLSSPLISATSLRSCLPSVKVIDASWYLPTEGRSGRAEFQKARIPSAQFFDLDANRCRCSRPSHAMFCI